MRIKIRHNRGIKVRKPLPAFYEYRMLAAKHVLHNGRCNYACYIYQRGPTQPRAGDYSMNRWVILRDESNVPMLWLTQMTTYVSWIHNRRSVPVASFDRKTQAKYLEPHWYPRGRKREG